MYQHIIHTLDTLTPKLACNCSRRADNLKVVVALFNIVANEGSLFTWERTNHHITILKQKYKNIVGNLMM